MLGIMNLNDGRRKGADSYWLSFSSSQLNTGVFAWEDEKEEGCGISIDYII